MIILFNSGSLVISSNRLLSCRVMQVFTEASEQNDICISALPSKRCFIQQHLRGTQSSFSRIFNVVDFIFALHILSASMLVGYSMSFLICFSFFARRSPPCSNVYSSQWVPFHIVCYLFSFYLLFGSSDFQKVFHPVFICLQIFYPRQWD